MTTSPEESDTNEANAGIPRRQALRLGVGAATMLAVPAAFTGPASAAVGPLRAPNAHGLRLPVGFTSRVVATTGQKVASSNYTWHAKPDGGACLRTRFGGWVYVSNSEVSNNGGGAGLIHFNRSGAIIGARRLLSGTSWNCAGGTTPWGTWLSCEEHSQGRVWETYPLANKPPVVRPAMGRFQHEAVAVDPVRRILFMTEDKPDGALYYFRPTNWPNLDSGRLYVLTTNVAGDLWWRRVPDPSASVTPTRYQFPRTKTFNGGEGIVFAKNSVYFATKGDNRIWRYRHQIRKLTVMYDDNTAKGAPGTIANGVDNLTANDVGSIFVAEDGGDMQIVLVKPGGLTTPIVQLPGVAGSELTGVAFNPAGNRMYFSSQRNPGRTYEVRGQFNGL